MTQELLEKLRKQIRNGDREIIAKQIGCSARTIDEALRGRKGRKSDAALAAFIQLLEERKLVAEEMVKRAENLV